MFFAFSLFEIVRAQEKGGGETWTAPRHVLFPENSYFKVSDTGKICLSHRKGVKKRVVCRKATRPKLLQEVLTTPGRMSRALGPDRVP